MENPILWVMVASLLLTVVSMGASLLLRVSLGTMTIQTNADLTKIRSDLREAIETTTSRFGETIQAIRQHTAGEVQMLRKEITDAEKFNRDTFARRESVSTMVLELKANLKDSTKELKDELKKLDEKIDGLIESLMAKRVS